MGFAWIWGYSEGQGGWTKKGDFGGDQRRACGTLSTGGRRLAYSLAEQKDIELLDKRVQEPRYNGLDDSLNGLSNTGNVCDRLLMAHSIYFRYDFL